MEFFSSYKEAFQYAFETQSFAVAHLYKLHRNLNIDTLGCFKLFYFASGDKKFNIGDKIYDCNAGDLFLIPVNEYHYFSNFQETDNHERTVCFIYPEYVKECSSDVTNLADCFLKVETDKAHKYTLNKEEQKHFLYHMTKLSESTSYGQELLDKSNFTKMMLWINQLAQKHSSTGQNVATLDIDASSHGNEQIDFLKSYIHEHITDDLTTEVLANLLYLSPTYLCRLFKQTTGTTLHKYITAQRITLAKGLLAEGKSVTDTCSACGFHDYSNFLKAFTKTVGISPKKYAQLAK